jgi:predicted RNA-binding protein YlxR (DUF448 family)
MPKQRHVPQRRCVACGTQAPHKELVRIVRTPEGDVRIDQDVHKAVGRGAYLCRSLECWDLGLKKSRLDHALRTRLSTENLQILQDFAGTLEQQE